MNSLLISYLSSVFNNIQLTCSFIAILTGALIVIHYISYKVSDSVDKNIIPTPINIPRWLIGLFCVTLILSIFIPTNLNNKIYDDLIDSYKKDLNKQIEEIQKSNDQIQEFNLFLIENNLVNKFTEFHNSRER